MESKQLPEFPPPRSGNTKPPLLSSVIFELDIILELVTRPCDSARTSCVASCPSRETSWLHVEVQHYPLYLPPRLVLLTLATSNEPPKRHASQGWEEKSALEQMLAEAFHVGNPHTHTHTHIGKSCMGILVS